MTNISVPRDLLERLANSRAFLHDTRKAQDELRTLLAQQADQVTEEVAKKASRFCNKCGYCGPLQTHNRPRDGVMCNYFAGGGE